VLDEMVDTLVTHPEVKKVRIEAHWDSGVAKDKAKELTEQQARTIASYLAKQGVSEDRIEVAGMGADRPIVPNIGAARFRNRRIEFHVVN
jgi:outer membrane protein OmpA-like peptidoglycan-associated protein